MSKDYYQILGVEKDANKEDIKKAFRKLAHKYHPDKQGGDEARFKEVNEAYGVLSDDKKRAEYDTYGRTFSGAAGSGFEGFDFSQFTQGYGDGGFEFDLGDIFGDFFGGRRQRRGKDIAIDTDLEFDESIFGVDREIVLNKVSECEICNGSGAESGSKTETCKTCNGKGTVKEVKRSIIGSFATTRLCDNCRGTGKVPEKKCKVCGGGGVKKQDRTIKINIPAGIEDGEVIRLSGEGEATPGGVAGDLYVRVRVDTHPIFKKSGQDLTMDLQIKLSDALLGATYKVKTLDGSIDLKIPSGVAMNEVLRVKGKGVPYDRNKRGDLMIKIKVEVPTKLSKEAKKKIEDLRDLGL